MRFLGLVYNECMVHLSIIMALATSPYHHVATVRSGGVGQKIEVRNTNGRTIWSRRFSGEVATRWSKDGKAFAVFDGDFYLTTWIEGQNVKKHKIGPRPGGMGEPPWYLHSLRWSPDKRRSLTIVPGTSGDTDYDCGWLLSIRVGTGQVQDVDGAIRETAEWLDSRTISYTGYRMVPYEGQSVFEGVTNQIARVK